MTLRPSLSARRTRDTELDASSDRMDALTRKYGMQMRKALAPPKTRSAEQRERALAAFKADRSACRAEDAGLTSCPTHGQFQACVSAPPRFTRVSSGPGAHTSPRSGAHGSNAGLTDSREALDADVSTPAGREGPASTVEPSLARRSPVARRAVAPPVTPAAPKNSTSEPTGGLS